MAKTKVLGNVSDKQTSHSSEKGSSSSKSDSVASASQSVTLESNQMTVSKCIPLSVTSRAAGFCAAEIFQQLCKCESEYPDEGSIYQFYRVFLALIETKIFLAQRDYKRRPLENPENYKKLIIPNEIIEEFLYINLPDPIARVVNTVGAVEAGNRSFMPVVTKNESNNLGHFVPQSEHVFLFNLRQTVESLSDVRTPGYTRKEFYMNNPIPGAIWTKSTIELPILANPDEIIPVNYNVVTDLKIDIADVLIKLEFMFDVDCYASRPVELGAYGEKGILVCNDQNCMRVRDREAGEPLGTYYSRISIDEDVSVFHNFSHLTAREQHNGNVCLLGERPVSTAYRYPYYVARDSTVCVQKSFASYKSCRNLINSKKE